MAIYDYPTSYVQPASISMTAKSAVGVNTSPFTYAQQVYSYDGQRWEMSINFPPMKLGDAEKVIGFFTRLNGREHYFNLVHPEAVTQNLQTDSNGVFVRISASQSTLKQLRLAHSGSLETIPVGTFITVPAITTTGANHLVKVTNVVSSSTLQKTVDIWPYLTGDIDDYDVDDVYMNPADLKGTWRLKSNNFTYDVNEASIYGMSIACDGFVEP